MKGAVTEKQETQCVSSMWANGEIDNDDDLFALSQEDVIVDQASYSYGSQTPLMTGGSKHDFDSADTHRFGVSMKTAQHSETSLGHPTESAVPLDQDILKEVVDLAIRRSIAERPLEMPKRTKVRNADVVLLSHLAPAIWSPSYQTVRHSSMFTLVDGHADTPDSALLSERASCRQSYMLLALLLLGSVDRHHSALRLTSSSRCSWTGAQHQIALLMP